LLSGILRDTQLSAQRLWTAANERAGRSNTPADDDDHDNYEDANDDKLSIHHQQ